jgi:hypothetical protein
MADRHHLGLGTAVATLALMLPALAMAQPGPGPDSENGRFTFSTTADGVLRLDTRSGQVATCPARAGGWACYAVPDERAALDAEIGRLVAENTRLKEALAARGDGDAAGTGRLDEARPKADRPGPDQSGSEADKRSRAQNRIEIPLPSDADLERAMSFLENVWRRLVEMASRVRDEVADRI